MNRTCKLCKNKNELQESHVIPKLLYRYMRRYQDRIKNLKGLLTIDSRNRKIDITQNQWKNFLFCRSCEQILSKNETKFAKILHQINEIPKKEISNIFYHSEINFIINEITNDNKFSTSEINEIIEKNYLDDEKAETLKYFAASFVLRQLYIIDNTLGKKEVKDIEDYLLGKSNGNFSLILKINNTGDFKSVSSTFPIDGLDEFKHYTFLAPEMWFHLIFDIKNHLDKPKIVITTENLLKEPVIKKLFSQAFKNATATQKASIILNNIKCT